MSEMKKEFAKNDKTFIVLNILFGVGILSSLIGFCLLVAIPCMEISIVLITGILITLLAMILIKRIIKKVIRKTKKD